MGKIKMRKLSQWSTRLLNITYITTIITLMALLICAILSVNNFYNFNSYLLARNATRVFAMATIGFAGAIILDIIERKRID